MARIDDRIAELGNVIAAQQRELDLLRGQNGEVTTFLKQIEEAGALPQGFAPAAAAHLIDLWEKYKSGQGPEPAPSRT